MKEKEESLDKREMEISQKEQRVNEMFAKVQEMEQQLSKTECKMSSNTLLASIQRLASTGVSYLATESINKLKDSSNGSFSAFEVSYSKQSIENLKRMRSNEKYPVVTSG